ncbi:MAG: hypothetical protein LBT20_03850 [Clostridiales bacterium]|jgi:hypothetical protein|nr:hypothetical protein [Clostridiales bacterium]
MTKKIILSVVTLLFAGLTVFVALWTPQPANYVWIYNHTGKSDAVLDMFTTVFAKGAGGISMTVVVLGTIAVFLLVYTLIAFFGKKKEE